MPAPRATGGDRRAPVVLAFDTAGSACSVAAGRGDTLLAHERQEMRYGHAEALLPMIDRAAAAAGLAAAAIDIIAVTVGPGGFTGLRAGLAAAQGLALAIRAQLVGVTGFDAVAALLPSEDAPLLVALDSRRDELYVQMFAGGGAPLGEPAAILPGFLPQHVTAAIGDRPLRIAGDVAAAAAAALAGRAGIAVVPRSAPDALGVWAAARRKVGRAPARPFYLRPPDVSVPKPRDNAGTRRPARPPAGRPV